MFNWCSKNKEKDFSDEKPLWNDKIVPVFLPKEPSLKVDPKNEVNFSINGAPYSIKPCDNIGVETSLNTYIRLYAKLPGTKFMCLEGGCGACIVNLRGPDPVSQQEVSWAANSCLTPVYSCDGLSITTIEGVGNRLKGYHALQEKLAKSHGTQCGGCTPGMIMNMFSLLQSSSTAPTMKEIENSFGGNICRCTGYRPILDAFKSFGSDAPQSLCGDIEDLGLGEKLCSKTGKACAGTCSTRTPLRLPDAEGRLWFKVFTVAEIFEVLNNNPGKYMLVHGNTAHGAYRRDPDIVVFVDLRAVKELKVVEFGANLVFGANVTLTNCMKALLTAANNNSADFEYCRQMWKHLDLVANVGVRNNGTLAGNLMIKHGKRDFPSDVFLLLETVGAILKIVDSTGKEYGVSPSAFLDLDMTKKVITQIILPPLLKSNNIFHSYKIMARSQNVHAYLNAGFLMKIDGSGIIKNATVVLGGVNPQFVHASVTENFLRNKNLYSNTTFQGAVKTLNVEVNPNAELPLASTAYRKGLALCLFYKFFLKIFPIGSLKPAIRSGREILDRPLSSGKQFFETDPSSWPINQEVTKLEALIQTSGEAQYVNDIPHQPNQLWAAFACASKFGLPITKIDASKALAIPGVRHFFTHTDIPGANSFTTQKIITQVLPEEVFASVIAAYAGQPVGMILADTFEIAYKAAALVEVSYALGDAKPMVTIHDVLREGATHRISEVKVEHKGTAEASEKVDLPIVHTVAGTFYMGHQYHFPMETLCCVTVPKDDVLEVYCPSQAIDITQIAISEALNVPSSKVNVYSKRLGGAFGIKISRAIWVAVACSLGAKLTNRPVRFTLKLEANMEIIGKRMPCLSVYTATSDWNGKLITFTNAATSDVGCGPNDPYLTFLLPHISNCYTDTVNATTPAVVLTDSAKNTWCRAPGTTEGIAMIENVLEHVARDVGEDPVKVKFVNIPAASDMKKIFPDFLADCDYFNRRQEINGFNSANRWRKRGIGVVPMRYVMDHIGMYRATLCISHGDGTVSIQSGATECGQGVNTKLCQVVAKYLGIPLTLVTVKKADSFIGSNNIVTGASQSSEGVCVAVSKACEDLNARLAPVKAKFPNATWPQLIQEAYKMKVDLYGEGIFNSLAEKSYIIWGVACAEVEIDLLTGNLLINRVDIWEDVGKSLSPGIDIGQIEGAFVMGIGYWLQEKIVFESPTGKLLTNRTWTYHPPTAKDIPVDFRIKIMNGRVNEAGYFGAKTVGEPAFCLAYSVICAVRHALDSARKDVGITEWYSMGAPTTVEDIFLNSGFNINQLVL